MITIAGERVDRLEQPGRGAGLQVDAGADAEDEPLGLGEVEVALEQPHGAGDVDVDVADLDVAQPEGARVEARVELGGDPDLARRGRGLGIVLEVDGERQRLAGRDMNPLFSAVNGPVIDARPASCPALLMYWSRLSGMTGCPLTSCTLVIWNDGGRLARLSQPTQGT